MGEYKMSTDWDKGCFKVSDRLCLGKEETYNASFDIGGPDVLTYKDMMKNYAKVRGLSLTVINVPVMTPKLSSYWLYFVTSTSYKLASNLVDSMRVNVIAKDNKLQDLLGIKPHTYEEAIEMAFIKIEQNQVISSWKDSKVSSRYSQKGFKQIHKSSSIWLFTRSSTDESR